jgi:ferric-dicitrate binding protein FerR (iron transport regulator)
MSERNELDELLAPMRDGPVALSSADEVSARRERLLPALRAAVGQVPVRRRRVQRARALGVAVGAAAAASLLLLGAQRLAAPATPTLRVEPLRVQALGPEPVTFIDADGARTELVVVSELTAPGEIVAPQGAWSRVSTQRGVRVDLAPSTRLRVTAAASQQPNARGGLRLEQGEVHCRVPRLGTRDQFTIETPDARVVVHGTVFSVRFGGGARRGTCVRVQEGKVEVQQRGSSVLLGAGAEWGCEPEPATVTAAPKLEARIEPGAAKLALAHKGASAARRSPAVRVPEGTLDRENALLAAALFAERQGDLAQAQKLFTELLAKHPRSPLVPEARVGLSRVR